MALILLVDDDPLVRNIFQMVLESAGHMVVTAEDGQEAFEAIVTARSFEIVVSDNDMGPLEEMSGMALLRKLRAAGNPIPFVLASGYAADKEGIPFRELCAQLEASFLQKPFPNAAFKEVVDKAVAKGLG